MFQPTFDRGHVDALSAFGLEKTAVSARLLSTLAGAGLGWASAQPGEGMQGALLGAGMGYGVGAGASRLGQGVMAAGRGAKNLAADAYRRVATSNMGQTMVDTLKHPSMQVRNIGGVTGIPQRMDGLTSAPRLQPVQPAALPAGNPRALPAASSIQQPASSLPPQGMLPPGQAPRALPPAQPGPGGLPPGPAAPRGLPGGPYPALPAPSPLMTADWAGQVPINLPAGQQVINAQFKRASCDAFAAFGVKVADSGLSLGIPGTPFGVGISDKDVRYDGMRRFVPRATYERAYDGMDMGLDPQALMELEQNQGTLMHPALGAAAGAFAAHKLLPQAGIPGKILGGLLGGGAGALYNAATAGDRAKDMQEAVRGVLLEQQKMRQRTAITDQPPSTANESTPLLVSRGEVG